MFLISSVFAFTHMRTISHSFSHTGPLNPLPSYPSKIKSCLLTVLAKSYHAPPLKAPPVPSSIASGVFCRERKYGGRDGSGVHVPLPSLASSRIDVWHGYMPDFTNGHTGLPLHVCHNPLPSLFASVKLESPSGLLLRYRLTRKDV